MKENNIISEETLSTVKINQDIAFTLEDIKKYEAIISVLADFAPLQDEFGGSIDMDAILENIFEKLEREHLADFLSWRVENGKIHDIKSSIQEGSHGIHYKKTIDALDEITEKYSDSITIEHKEITIYEDDIDMDASKYHGVGWVEKLGKWIAVKDSDELTA